MALLAQERRTGFQQWCNVRSVWAMAVGAIFRHRLVLPKKGAAFFCVAGVAGLSTRIFLQQLRTRRTVWVMAIRANHFPFADGVMRNFLAISALFFVASKANFSLCFLAQYWIGWTVNFVTVIASHTIVLVLCAVPMGTVSAFVASQTLRSTFFVISNRESAFLEDDVRCSTALDVGITLYVLVALAVARLAIGRA